jgi:membrane associated rhomboid family serine protease
MEQFFDYPATYGLIFLIAIITGYALNVDLNLNNRLDLDVGRVLHQKQYYRLVTSGFVHADPMHFLFNVITLYSFGPFVESALGLIPFLVLYFGSELAANVLTLYLKQRSPGYSSLGASGAICGVVLSACLFSPFSKLYIMFVPIGIPAFIYGICYIGYSMFQVQSNARDGTAHEAHLGGALAGLAITVMFQPYVVQSFLAHFGM